MSIYPKRKTVRAGYKCCAMCNKVKQVDSFHMLKPEKRYRSSYCKPCLSIYMRSRYNFLKKNA